MLRSKPYNVAAAAFFLLTFFWCLPSLIRNRPHLINPSLDDEIAYSSSEFNYVPGTLKAAGANYSKTLVVARLESEDVSWLDSSKYDVQKAIYVVDNPSLSPDFRIPQNKGHEAMVYLSYIIDHYDNLSDITVFVHSHQKTWHNNDLLDSDMLVTIEHLSAEHVIRQGYFNLRCHHEPGCPDWLHLDRPDDQLDTYRKMEERAFSLDVWHELHPGVPPPKAISQPCCAQFAVSRERIGAIPKKEYVRYRDWLLHTKLSDTYSGRVMEYSWQYLFAGVPELCPAMHVCYCEGYGICFGRPEQMDEWFEMRGRMWSLNKNASEIAETYGSEREEEVRGLRVEAQRLDVDLDKLKKEAFERGRDARPRRKDGGRN